MDYFAHMKPFILFGSSMVIIVILISALAFINKKNEIPEKHVEVVLRDIGHQLLLSAKDSLSRVLPVKAVPKVAMEENNAASREALPQVVVHPPKREKKRRATFPIPWSGLSEPE